MKGDKSTDLVIHEIPCMREGCKRVAQIKLPPGAKMPRGMRKWCLNCASTMGNMSAGMLGNGAFREGNRKA